MRQSKRIISLLLALIMVVSLFMSSTAMMSFAATDPYTDVTAEDWFYENVKSLKKMKLMIGYKDGTFRPEEDISLAESVTVAARLHADYTKAGKLRQKGLWYSVYADYALTNGILDKAPADYEVAATRLEFAHLLAKSLPLEGFTPLNRVPDGAIPDVKGDEAIYMLYRAGVLIGADDSGNFYPERSIKRSEVAAIITRMADPSLRLKSGIFGIADVELDGQGNVKTDVSIDATDAKATVAAGTAAEDGAGQLSLSVSKMETTGGNISLDGSEELSSYDVHIDGLAKDNTVPVLVELNTVLPIGLNLGNLAVYHVEDGVTNTMTQVLSLAELDEHNEFYYDPATGKLTVAMATFSEVSIAVNAAKEWEGNLDYSWYDADATELTIANADQLAAFGAIVGGMKKVVDRGEDGTYTYSAEVIQDSFEGQTIKLISDINLADGEDANDEKKIFYPIGYWNNEGTYERLPADQRVNPVSSGLRNFEGTFDGNGHSVSNFYQNTWEMKGDHDWYNTTTEQYYRDGMGLFGRVYKGTVKNLTVSNFKSDGEIATTGVIAAYADGATFENIAVFNCNPRVYNIGNGGIVGCVGWYAKEADLETTFTNITVDNSNKISALWGSYDVACGGIVGQYYPTSGQSSANYPVNGGVDFVNCHVSAVMDVYNDVCANYQYYAYRYTGMLIGSVRENETIDGHTYPKMNGITAEGCTVHFGTWNDYYYCEIIDNTTASYTHDYQMSRLDEIKAINGTTVTYLDGTTGTVPASGRANYVIVDYTKGHGTDNATCYHFKDGNVWTHDMGGIQTGIDENGDGQDDLKEDKQHIYLEFNNLVTGYGWGVTSKGIGDLVGVTILDRVEGNSVEKFAKKDDINLSEIKAGDTVSVSNLFKAIENTGVEIKNNAVTVSVTDLTETGITANFTRGTTWEKGSLKFNGTNGIVKITIQDYYFCTPTSVIVEVGDFKTTDRFSIKFPNVDKYLYRVGNKNEITVSSLFGLLNGVEKTDLGNVSIAVTDMNGNTLDVYTAGSEWNSGKIKFNENYTGPVKINISDDNFSTPVELNVEVVDAKNVTTATSATANNVVLLNDVSGSFSVSGGYTVYGNGFEVTLPTTYQASYTAGFVGYVYMSGGNLDNVRITGPVYPEMNIYQSQAQNSTTNKEEYFFNSVYIYGGNNTISNSYISGSRTAVCIRGANSVEIENTTLSGGAVANMQIEGANQVILRNLTTVQKDETDSYGKGVTAHGMGVLVGCGAEITIEGELNQYNWLSHSQWKAIVGSYESGFPYFYTNNTYADYQHTRNGETYVNIAFVFATDWDTNKLIVDNQTNKDQYKKLDDITVQGYNGGVYSVANQVTVTDEMYNAPDYQSEKYNPIAPMFKFDNAVNNDTDDENDATDTYCVYDEESGVLKIGVTGNSKTLDLSGISVTKDGAKLSHTAYLNGTQISGNSVTIKEEGGTTQSLMVKVTVTEVGYDKNGQPITGSKEYNWPIKVEFATLSNPAPVWNMNETYTFSAKDSGCVYVYYQTNKGYGEAVPIFNGIKVNYYNKDGQLNELDLSDRVDLPNKDTQPIKQDFTVTLDDGSKLTMNATGSYKSGVTSLYFTVYNNKVYAYPSDLKTDSWVRPSTNGYDFNIKFTYQFTDPNGLSTEKITVNWYSPNTDNVTKTVQWQTFDGQHGEKDSTCLAEGTMITMADGTKRAVEDLRKGDSVLAFDHLTGEIVANDVIIVVKTQSDFYKNTFVFDDGTQLATINEHGIYDLDLNRYVNIDHSNADNYIGHTFVSVDANGNLGTKKLVDVVSVFETGYKYDIVTNQTLNYVAEDTLSVTHVLVDVINTFEFDDNMCYDQSKMAADIEKYGLYTYDEWEEYCDISVFEQYNIPVMKVGISKGLYTKEYIIGLINTYVLDDSVQIID